MKLYVYDCEPDESICGKRFLIIPQKLNLEEMENSQSRASFIEILDTFYQHNKAIYAESIEAFETMLNPNETATLYLKFKEQEFLATCVVPDLDSGIILFNDLEKKKVDKMLHEFRNL